MLLKMSSRCRQNFKFVFSRCCLVAFIIDMNVRAARAARLLNSTNHIIDWWGNSLVVFQQGY